jgi:hypothetical protein
MTVQAMPRVELVVPKIQALHPGFMHAPDAETGPPPPRSSSPSRTLDLSASRTHDFALDILAAYKLSGNFHINLEIVLRNLGVFEKVGYEIEPETLMPFHSDRRHVAFWPSADVPVDQFNEIARSITGRIGFDATPPWWGSVVVRAGEIVANAWRAAMADQAGNYRPEAHYMRGPGPKWRAKHAQVSIRR